MHEMNEKQVKYYQEKTAEIIAMFHGILPNDDNRDILGEDTLDIINIFMSALTSTVATALLNLSVCLTKGDEEHEELCIKLLRELSTQTLEGVVDYFKKQKELH